MGMRCTQDKTPYLTVAGQDEKHLVVILGPDEVDHMYVVGDYLLGVI